jgi:hypothetical protein
MVCEARSHHLGLVLNGVRECFDGINGLNRPPLLFKGVNERHEDIELVTFG